MSEQAQDGSVKADHSRPKGGATKETSEMFRIPRPVGSN
jgi:hypothetical protein